MMHPYDKRSHRQPERASAEPMDGRTRLLIVGGILLLAVYLAWPFMRGGLGSIGRERWRRGDSPDQRRWRLCQDTPDGKTCTPWQTGPAPREYGGR
jgi:hypothetical protein